MRLSSAALLLPMAFSSTVAFQMHYPVTVPPAGRSSSSDSSSRLSMVTTGPMRCRPIGIGSAAPKTIITNKDLESVVETSDEWIRTRTGISQRHVLLHPLEEIAAEIDTELDNDDINTDDNTDTGTDTDTITDSHEPESIKTLATEAAQKALTMSGLPPSSIDLVLVATSSPDDLFGDATSVAAGLGCTNAVAFDLTAACSGFLFGAVTAGQFLDNAGNQYHNAIVVGADALSRWIDWDDRNSCILFGDGAGAVVLTTGGDDAGDGADADDSDKTDNDMIGILGSSAHSNGLGYKELNCGYEGSARHVATPGEGTTLSKGSYNRLAMNGKEVYKFATREVPRVINEALEAADLTVDDVDHLLLHQANIRIMETVAKRLGMPMDKVITNLEKYGNTSAGSIPLALDEAVRTGQVKKGDVIACAGFGAGLSWGSAILKWG